MTYAEWAVALDGHEQDPKTNPHIYFKASNTANNAFIDSDLPIFKNEPSLFIVDPAQQRGVHCRFGMSGIIAESHYDSGRNMVALVQGKRRYILLAPDQCSKIPLYKTGPMARHGSTDWSDPKEFHKFGDATAIDVVLNSGEVLYIPALWFHYIISLSPNIQCNSRSGTPPAHAEAIKACGFNPGVTEQEDKRPAMLGPDMPLTTTAEDAEAAVQELQKGLDAAGATSQGVTVDIPAGYPQGFPLQNILREWNPDDVRIPAHYPSKYNSLAVLRFPEGPGSSNSVP